jgi:hypothetical protein
VALLDLTGELSPGIEDRVVLTLTCERPELGVRDFS